MTTREWIAVAASVILAVVAIIFIVNDGPQYFWLLALALIPGLSSLASAWKRHRSQMTQV